MGPLVSIGMSVFNCGSTLVPSIRSLLHQTYDNWELILIDDGSTDDTPSLVKEFHDQRIRFIVDGLNKGLAVRLNQAVDLSRGTYFARMDGGDVAYPERLAVQLRFLEAHSRVDLVASRVIIFRGPGCVVGTYPFFQTHEAICKRPWAGFQFPHPTWMGKTEWFRKNRYSSSMRKSQDQELLLRTYRQSRFESLDHILLGYRKDRLSLRDILKSRYSFSQSLMMRAGRDRNPVLVLGVLENALKALIETFSITTGLDYRILRRRALPVALEEIYRWQRVWRAITEAKG
ncbi:MAG: glycosyltransferase family 2 protein [Deltaproteobacteria bacterium]|nr:glycosyltransferase family 2 protein [Deltaproteobacteria bacterium]